MLRNPAKHYLIFVLSSAAMGTSAFAMDCTLSREDTSQAWKASCGLHRAGPQWSGFIQGPLSGSHLTFSNTQQKKTVEGGILSPLSELSEIPSCHSPSAGQNETCNLIAKKISLSLPFTLIAYAQDPVAFTIGSRWDARTKNIAQGSELTIAACGVGPEKKPDETAPLLYFKSTMDCKWNELPTHPLAINCKSPTQGGILQVNAGNIRCELRQKETQEKAIVTDLISVVCLRPSGKAGATGIIDPISCLGDDRIGFTTQTELRGKIRAPRPEKTIPTSKGAAGINGT